MVSPIVTVVTAPTLEPLDLATIKSHCRIDGTADDGLLLEVYLPAAREHLEFLSRYQWLTSTLLYADEAFPRGGTITLPRPPLQSVTSVTYHDENNALQTWANTNYYVDIMRRPGRLVLAPSISWPATYGRPNAVQITYVAGWTTPALMFRAFHSALLLLIAHLYEQREETVEHALHEIPNGICALVGMHRLEEV